MSVIIGNKTFVNQTPSNSTYTFSHNQNVGNGKYLLIYVCMSNSVNYTSCTYNGVTMSLLLNFNSAFLGQRWAVFGLSNADSGSNNVILNFSGTQWNPISVSVLSFTSCKGVGVVGNNDVTTSPNPQTNKYNPNSAVAVFGVSGTNQTTQYTVGGNNVAFDFLHNTGQIVRGGVFNPIPSFGDLTVTTFADSGGSISNTRIELLDYVAGLVAINTEIAGNRITFNEFKKGLIALNTEVVDKAVFNTFVKGLIGITTEVTPHLGIQNKTDISQNFNN